MFLNGNLTHEQILLLQTEKRLSEMSAESKGMYKSELLKSKGRPTTDKFSALRSFFLTEFAIMYYKNIPMMVTIFNQTIYQIP